MTRQSASSQGKLLETIRDPTPINTHSSRPPSTIALTNTPQDADHGSSGCSIFPNATPLTFFLVVLPGHRTHSLYGFVAVPYHDSISSSALVPPSCLLFYQPPVLDTA